MSNENQANEVSRQNTANEASNQEIAVKHKRTPLVPIYHALSYLSWVLLESISLSFGKNKNVLDQPWLVSNGLPGWRITYMYLLPRTIKVRGFTSAPSVLKGKESLCK